MKKIKHIPIRKKRRTDKNKLKTEVVVAIKEMTEEDIESRMGKYYGFNK